MAMNKRDDTKWRGIACILALVWGILLLLNMRFYMQRFTEKDILMPISYIALYGFTILGCFLLAIFPLQFYIYTFFCCLWGVLNIAEGGSALSVLMYGLGLFFAWKKGFFATRWRVKLSLASILLIAALFSQLRYGGETFLDSLIDLFGLFIMMAIVVFLARHELKILRKNKTLSMDMQQFPSATEVVKHPSLSLSEPEAVRSPLSLSATEAVRPPLSLSEKKLTLPRNRFKRKDVAMAHGILDGKKYAAIAIEQEMALSTLKRRAKLLYEYANVADQRSFIAEYEGYTVELGNRQIAESALSPARKRRWSV